MKVDYHMHTLCSDGICEVEAVVDMAVNCGILAMAVTDHDTLSGIGRARQCCLGRIRYVTGTEITCAEHLGEFSPFPSLSTCLVTGSMRPIRCCARCSPPGKSGRKPSTRNWQRL